MKKKEQLTVTVIFLRSPHFLLTNHFVFYTNPCRHGVNRYPCELNLLYTNITKIFDLRLKIYFRKSSKMSFIYTKKLLLYLKLHKQYRISEISQMKLKQKVACTHRSHVYNLSRSCVLVSGLANHRK